MNQDKIKVLLVEDNLVFQTGISFLIQGGDKFELVDKVASGLDAVARVKTMEVDVVIMDLYLPDIDGVEATRQILEYKPDIKVLACSAERDEEKILQIVQAGALGFIYKNASTEEFRKALEIVAAGNTYFSREIFSILVTFLQQAGQVDTAQPGPADPERLKELKEKLSPRELEILKYIAEEMTNKEIAEKLFISPRTVDTHRRNLLQKLKVKNTAGLVKYYMAMMM